MSGSIADSTLINSARLRAYTTDQTQAPGEVGTDPAIGKGLAALGPAPDAPAVASYTALMKSVAAIMPQMTSDELDALLVEATSALQEVVSTNESEKVKTDQAVQSAALKEKAEKLREAADKMLAAAEERKRMGIWDIIKTAFQMLGALITMAIGAVMVATGVGAVAGGLMIAAGALMLFSAIDGIVSQATAKDGQPGLGIGGLMAKTDALARGMSEEKATEYAKTAAMGMGIGIAMLTAILAIASGVASATSLASAAGQAAQTAVKTTAQLAKDAIGIADDVTNIAVAIGDAAAAGVGYQTTMKQADATVMQADAKRLEAMMTQLEDFIDMALTRLKGALDRSSEMLDLITDGMEDRAASTSRFKFGA